MTALAPDDLADWDSPRLLPTVRVERDRAVPVIVAASLLLHVTLLLPLLLRDRVGRHEPQEIPVELVQAPPPKPPEKAAETPKPAPKPPAAQKQPEQTKAPAPRPPVSKPKPVAAKPSAPKPPAPKPPASKAQPQRPQSKPAETAHAESTTERMSQLLGYTPPGLGAVALPGASADGTENVSYAQLVMSQVAKAKRQGRYKGTPGRATVAFTLTDSGAVDTIAIKTPSGVPSLDEEAIAMVKRGAPYPPPPPGAGRGFVVGLQFRVVPE